MDRTNKVVIGVMFMAYLLPLTAFSQNVHKKSVWHSSLGGHKVETVSVAKTNELSIALKRGKQLQALEYEKALLTLQNQVHEMKISRKLLDAKAEAALDTARQVRIPKAVPAQAVSSNPPAQAVPVKHNVEIKPPVLKGIFIKGNMKLAAISSAQSGETVTLQEGQQWQGYTVKKISPRQVELTNKHHKTLVLHSLGG